MLVDAGQGLVLTNFHVIALGEDLQAGTPDRLDDAEIEAAAPCEDPALLKVQGLEGRRAIPLGRQDEVEQGDPVVALGYPVSASGGRLAAEARGHGTATHTVRLMSRWAFEGLGLARLELTCGADTSRHSA